MELPSIIFSMPSLIGIAYIGMFAHFLKKKIKGETLTDITGFFKDNVKSTMSAMIATGITALGLYTLHTGEVIDILAFFKLGYMCDSSFNKWDSNK